MLKISEHKLFLYTIGWNLDSVKKTVQLQIFTSEICQQLYEEDACSERTLSKTPSSYEVDTQQMYEEDTKPLRNKRQAALRRRRLQRA